MTLSEDEQQKLANHAAAKFAIVRKIGLTLIKKDIAKGSLKSKRFKAAWNKNFLISQSKFKFVCP